MSNIDRDRWNNLVRSAPPFLHHDFLAALEQTGCVSDATGWRPRHITIESNGGELIAALPLYEKSHSWGEFVFDWSWADAYRQAGVPYYPKLVSTSPFTPATSPRFLVNPDYDTDEYARHLLEAAESCAGEMGASSLHLQFVDQPAARICSEYGLSIRRDCQFHWKNLNYSTFDDFLAGFSSAKRKKVRRERRRVSEAGIGFQHCPGGAMTESDWHDAWQLTRQTFLLRGREPYLSLEFFLSVAATAPNTFHTVFAVQSGRRIAAALFFASDTTLYGRYWGSDAEYHSLHFETCYYQGIDYCISAGLQSFEPGTQGEHKVSRGFLPQTTWSAHWLKHPRFAEAIDQYLGREGEYINDYMDSVSQHTPFRRTPPETRSR